MALLLSFFQAVSTSDSSVLETSTKTSSRLNKTVHEDRIVIPGGSYEMTKTIDEKRVIVKE